MLTPLVNGRRLESIDAGELKRAIVSMLLLYMVGWFLTTCTPQQPAGAGHIWSPAKANSTRAPVHPIEAHDDGPVTPAVCRPGGARLPSIRTIQFFVVVVVEDVFSCCCYFF